MPREGIPGYLKYRVLNANSGAVLIPDLAHPHQSSWTVRAMQKGFPAAAQIGDFRLPLWDPLSEEFRRYRSQLNSLAAGQKVEAYLGDVITGSPRFSGVITKITKPVKGPWLVEGVDTLWWLQQSQTFPGELVQQQLGSGLVGGYLGTQEIVWTDNFSTFTGYTQTGPGSFAQNNSDPYFGLPNIQISGTSADSVLTNSNWSRTAQYVVGVISMRGTAVCGTATTAAGNFGIWFMADLTAANGIFVNVQVDSTAGGPPYSAHLQIWSSTGGTLTKQAEVLNTLTGLNATFQFELQAVLTNNITALTNNVRAILNGRDVGCSWTGVASAGVSPGSIGIRYAPAVGGTPALYVNNLQFEARTSVPSGAGPGYATSFGVNRFAAGNIATSPSQNLLQTVTLANQSHLDCMLLASLVDGFFLRKNPGAGYKADSIDYAAQPGVDRSAQIVFDESNIVDGFVGPVPDLLATNVRLNHVRGSDSGGIVTWPRIGSLGDMVLTDTVQDVGIPGFRWAMLYALQVQARKASPNAATQLEVLRTADAADKWRELDFVLVNHPLLGVFKQKSLVMGYTFTEGAGTQTVYLSQFSMAALPKAALTFMQGPIEWLTAVYQNR